MNFISKVIENFVSKTKIKFPANTVSIGNVLVFHGVSQADGTVQGDIGCWCIGCLDCKALIVTSIDICLGIVEEVFISIEHGFHCLGGNIEAVKADTF